MLWAVQETADGAPAKQAGPTLILYPSGGQSPFTALLDSGAVRNYVSHEMAVARGWKISPCSTSAKLANGAVVKLRGTTEVAVIVRTPVRPPGDSSSVDLAQDGHLQY
ncbi:hypothetical protein FOZ63_024652, partial [Perkinsus olseni]